jgi:cyanophycin synthetase
MMYKDGSNGRIPVVAIAGTNGKTTTSRLIGRIFEANGQRVGMTSTDGVYIQGRQIDRATAPARAAPATC